MQLVLKGLWSCISSTKIATSQFNVVIGSILRRGQNLRRCSLVHEAVVLLIQFVILSRMFYLRDT
jgi:hypothetical protein